MTNIRTVSPRRAYVAGIPWVPRILGRVARIVYGCEIPYTAAILTQRSHSPIRAWES